MKWVVFLFTMAMGCAPAALPLNMGNPKWGVEIIWHGHSCFTLKDSLERTIVIDPFDDTVGYEEINLYADAIVVTHDHFDHNESKAVKGLRRSIDLIKSTGTFTVASGLQIKGLATDHDTEEGSIHGPNRIYQFTLGGLNIVHLGDFGESQLSPDLIKKIGKVDILFIPVGGVTTIDARQAKEIVDQLNPPVVFPMHYGDIRFYRLAPVTAFTSLFDADQKKIMNQSQVRIQPADLAGKPTIYTLKPTNKNTRGFKLKL